MISSILLSDATPGSFVDHTQHRHIKLFCVSKSFAMMIQSIRDILSAEMRSPVHTEVRLWLWYCMRWPWCLSRTPFNQWAASSFSNYCSGRPSPSLGNLSITHFHFFPGSHKSLVLSLLQSPSKRPRGSLDTCVNNRWQVCPPSSKGRWRREHVYVFFLLHWLNSVAVCLHTSCFCAYLCLSLCFLPLLFLSVSLSFSV